MDNIDTKSLYIDFLKIKDASSGLKKREINSFSFNQILYGPPGTGKTYNTINRALEIIDGVVPQNRSEAKARFEELSSAGQIEFVTFHQSYGYEEFVEGIKANTVDGQISYDVEGGVFKKLCNESLKVDAESILKALDNYLQNNDSHDFVIKDNIIDITINQNNGYNFSNHHSISRENAYKCMQVFFSAKDIESLSAEDLRGIGAESHRYTYFHFIKKFYTLLVDSIDNTNLKDKNYILIIDEINRGNISKIFGELITLIEPSKRLGADEEIKLRLPYSNDEFGVPCNLYIIGTMNTADRSIALMDTALRRRFEFVEMMPDAELLDFEIESINLKALLNKINARVEYLYDRDHTIGHAYFMDLNAESSLEELNAIMRNKIIPLLQEYFYDDWEKIRLVLNDGFILKRELKAKNIFDESIDDEYIEEDKFLYSVCDDFEVESYQRLCQNS